MFRHSRRELLRLCLAMPLLGGTRELGHTPLISVQDFQQFPSLLTSIPDFFIRNHFDAPLIDLQAYRLRLAGLVAHEAEVSLDTLAALPSVHKTALLECAGNGVGVGAVGCAHWEGPLLRTVLELSRRKPEGRFVRFTGADTGSEVEAAGLTYSRTLPLAEALDGHTILALHMNGEPLKREHGGPARIIAAGRYGMDSVKWLREIEVVDRPDNSFYMANRFRRVVGTTPGDRLDFIKVKSIIVNPIRNQPVRADILRAGGYAWAGREAVKRVDIRIDGGVWTEAHLDSRPKPLTWIAWRFEASNLRPGAHNIEARAVSESGEAQPEQRESNRTDAYELNQVERVPFFFRP